MQEQQQFQDEVRSKATNRNKDPEELKAEGLDLLFYQLNERIIKLKAILWQLYQTGE